MGGSFPKSIEQPAVAAQPSPTAQPMPAAAPAGVAVMGVPHLTDSPTRPQMHAQPAVPLPGIQDGIEIHENKGEIHFHDRQSPDKLKVAYPVVDFWSAWKKFINKPIGSPPLVIVDEQRNTMVTLEKVFGYVGQDSTIDVKITMSRVSFGVNWKHISDFVTQK